MDMQILLQLISEWGSFNEHHSDAPLADFCNYFLEKEKVKGSVMGSFELTITAARSLGRVAAMNQIYIKAAFKEYDIAPEWFYVLVAINKQKEARKIDIINYILFEQSTGIDMLSRMKVAGYISERTDPVDKRAKLVKLTLKGEQLLLSLQIPASKATYYMFGDMPDAEKKLIISLLKNMESMHEELLTKDRLQIAAEISKIDLPASK